MLSEAVSHESGGCLDGIRLYSGHRTCLHAVMARIPTASDVAALSRDDWEALCRSLAAIIHQAEGIEDRRGKGNGMDVIRIDPDGASGWQFRRFDARFGDKQAADIRAAVRLAKERTLVEDGLVLRRFAVWANVDLEPGHLGKTGERERFARLRKQIQDELDVIVEFKGISWVHAQLLERPKLRPDLFEDVAGQIEAAEVRAKARYESIIGLLSAASGPDAARASARLQRLIEQAGVHFERGLKHGGEEQFLAAVGCLRDALNLLKDLDADLLLEGRVLVALAGVEMRLGHLPDAEKAARAALRILPTDARGPIAHARGTLGMILGYQQDYDEAERLLGLVLDEFEGQGNSVEIVRTLTNILELQLNRGWLEIAGLWAHRLISAASDLHKTVGVSDLTVAAFGALARSLIDLGYASDQPELLRQAEAQLLSVEDMGRQLGSPHISITAMGQRAGALRFQDRLDEAEALYHRAASMADAQHMEKAAADLLYNRAIVFNEAGRNKEAHEVMLDACRRYEAIGDANSARDAVASLKRWEMAI